MKRLLGAAWFLALAGCAHGGGAGLASKPHQALTLIGPSGLDAQQEPVLEGTLCQALVEVNQGDVGCPSSVRATLGLARERAMMTGNTADADASVPDANPAGRQVRAAVTHAGASWVLNLEYREAADGPAKATKSVSADSFDELVQHASDGAKALLQ